MLLVYREKQKGAYRVVSPWWCSNILYSTYNHPSLPAW